MNTINGDAIVAVVAGAETHSVAGFENEGRAMNQGMWAASRSWKDRKQIPP